MDAASAGIRTPDLKGHASTTEFTDAVIERLRAMV
jgi:isocitrate/isopropylmalate dehydrogenase